MGNSGKNHGKGSDDNDNEGNNETKGDEGDGDKGNGGNFPKEGDNGPPPAARLDNNQLLR